jgi:hypothetical protein
MNTEQDWVDLIEKDRKLTDMEKIPTDKIDDLQWKMLGWADWVEEQGLGYEEGLRTLANHPEGPRYPWSNLNGSADWYDSGYWSFTSTTPVNVSDRLGWRYQRKKFPTILEAVKTVALAMQEVHQEPTKP